MTLKNKYDTTTLNKINRNINLVTKFTAVAFFTIFPLIVFTDYTNITAVKYNTFIIISILFFGYYIFEKGSLVLNGYRFSFKLKDYIPYILIGLFLIFNIVSCIFSPLSEYTDKSSFKTFIIGSGRYDGLLVMAIYILLFVLFSLEGTFGLLHVNIITAVTFVMVTIGYLQMFDINVFGFYPAESFYKTARAFVSTIGNIDIMSTYLCIALAVIGFSAVSFNVKKYLRAIWLFVYGLSLLFLLLIEVSSGAVAIYTMLFIALPIVTLKKDYLIRFLDVVSVSIVSFGISKTLLFEYTNDEFKFNFIFKKALIPLFAVVLALILIRFLLQRFLGEKRLKLYSVLILISEILLIIGAIVYLKYSGNFQNGTLYELSQILNGNAKDTYGSSRYGLWKYTLELIGERPIIGYGTASYRTIFTDFAAKNCPAYLAKSYDFAHNEYLQILYNSGILGLAGYLGFIGFCIVKSFKKIFLNPKLAVLFFAVISYLIQAFFTFSVVIVSPIFWIILGMFLYETKKTLKNPKKVKNPLEFTI